MSTNEGDESFPLISRFPLFSKIFENKMCQTWCKQLKNEGIWSLYSGFPFISPVRTFFSAMNNYYSLKWPYCIKESTNLCSYSLNCVLSEEVSNTNAIVFDLTYDLGLISQSTTFKISMPTIFRKRLYICRCTVWDYNTYKECSTCHLSVNIKQFMIQYFLGYHHWIIWTATCRNYLRIILVSFWSNRAT
jgi:hypothetical protein